MRTLAEQSVLTDNGRRIASGMSSPRLAELRQSFETIRLVQLDDFVDAEIVATVLARTVEKVRMYALRDETPHKVEPGRLYGGARFSIVDWGSGEGSDHDQATREAIREGFSLGGLDDLCAAISHDVKPLVERITGEHLTYDRPLLFIYGEGDFIDPHGDSTTKRRVMVQLPVCFNCRNALRVLKNGYLEPFYDEPGCLRILGPGVWHDVLPVLRLMPDRDPLRVMVSMKFDF